MIPDWKIAAALLLGAFIAVLFFLARKKRRAEIVSEMQKTKSPEELHSVYMTKCRNYLWTCFQRYKKALERMNIPPDAMIIKKCTSIFHLEHTALSHYIWIRDGSLCFFPKWEDIGLSFAADDFIPANGALKHGKIYASAIPLDFIKHYEVDDVSGTTSIYYADTDGRRYKTVFLEYSGEIFAKLFPQKDYELVKRREYLGSYDNILDMNKCILELKNKREKGLISQMEYEVQKEMIVREL